MSALKETAAKLLEVARDSGADDAIVEVMDSTTSQIRYSSGRIDASNWWNEKHAVVFVAVGNRTLSSDIKDMDHAKELTGELVLMAKASPPNKGYGGIAEGRFKYSRSRLDRSIVALRDPSRPVHEAINAAQSHGAIDVGGTLFVRHEKVALASTGGPSAEDENASVDLSVRAFSQKEASGHAVSCTPRLAALKAKETGARAGELANMAKDPVPGDEGKFDLVLEPLFLGGITHSLAHMMSALRVEIGLSVFAKKIGKQVASKEVTFVDDPMISSTSRRAFDHEGMPTRRNTIIKDGVLNTYVHNTSTAKRFKTKSTANAGPLVPTLFAMATQPMPFHPVIEPGDWHTDEIVEETKRGLYLNNTWYTRYQNYATGDFSTIPRDAILMIENGEIVGPAKNIRVSDNVLNMLKSVDAVSKQSQEVYWWDEAAPPSTLPVIRVKGMTITRSS